MTPPGITPEDQREIEALLETELQHNRLTHTHDRARLKELGWILIASVVAFAVVIISQFSSNEEKARLVSTYACCIAVTLAGWGIARSMLCYMRAPKSAVLYLIFGMVFGAAFGFFVLLLINTRDKFLLPVGPNEFHETIRSK